MNFLNEIKKRLSKNIAPIQASVRSANKRAEALIRANLRSAAKPPTVHPSGKSSHRSVGAGGVTSHSNRYKEPDSVIKIGGREVSRTVGDTEYDLSFGRNTPDYEDSLSPRRNISPANAKLRQANIKFQNGVLLSEVKPGERVTATPIPSESGRDVRAAIYSRMTGGALKSGKDEYGGAAINSRRLSPTEWRNVLGEKKTFDPKELTKDLAKLAARRLVTHPAAQAALIANDAVKAVTGKSATEHVGAANRKTTAESIKARLKKGERYFVPQRLPY